MMIDRTHSASIARALTVWLAAGVALGWPAAPASAKSEQASASGARRADVDHLALAALLVRDGHDRRAAAVLGKVDPARRSEDGGRYHVLAGILALRAKRYRRARDQLQRALSLSRRRPAGRDPAEHRRRRATLHLLVAQARFSLHDYRGTLRALARSRGRAARTPAVYAMRAECHEKLGDEQAAWNALADGLHHHPDNRDLLRRQVVLLVGMKLYRQAIASSQALFEGRDTGVEDYLLIARALLQAEQRDDAIVLLEQARLRYPDDVTVLGQLARAYAAADKPLAAAGLLRAAAAMRPKLHAEAAEMYRRAGRLRTALWLNRRVTDVAVKTRQRFGLLIALDELERAAALQPRLSRLGLLDDQRIRYALAYVHYRNGRFAEAEQLLAGIRDAKLFGQAIALRRAMAECRRKRCRP